MEAQYGQNNNNKKKIHWKYIKIIRIKNLYIMKCDMNWLILYE